MYKVLAAGNPRELQSRTQSSAAPGVPCEAFGHAGMHKQAIQNWKPSDLPSWLSRDVYVKQVQPALASVAKSQIRAALGVNEPYSSAIQTGKCVPHPRHWQALAQLGGVSPTVQLADEPAPGAAGSHSAQKL